MDTTSDRQRERHEISKMKQKLSGIARAGGEAVCTFRDDAGHMRAERVKPLFFKDKTPFMHCDDMGGNRLIIDLRKMESFDNG